MADRYKSNVHPSVTYEARLRAALMTAFPDSSPDEIEEVVRLAQLCAAAAERPTKRRMH